jgi:hypothetical protein
MPSHLEPHFKLSDLDHVNVQVNVNKPQYNNKKFIFYDL